MKLEYSEKQKEEKGNEEVDSREVEIPSSEKENIPDDFHFDKTQNLV